MAAIGWQMRSFWPSLCHLCQQRVPHYVPVCYNSNKKALGKIKYHPHVRLYPTTIVNSDGSTIIVRHPEPRKIIKLPLDLNTLTEEEKLIRLKRRQPKQKIKIVEDDFDDTFDPSDYSSMTK